MGSRGGPMRAKILKLLSERPMNAHQLAEALGVNYRTITHHLNVLLENGLIVAEGPKYGTPYFPSKTFLDHSDVFMKIMSGQLDLNKRRKVV